MKTINQGSEYLAPQLSVIKVCTEGMLCASTLWYQRGASGDFLYGIDTDDTWA